MMDVFLLLNGLVNLLVGGGGLAAGGEDLDRFTAGILAAALVLAVVSFWLLLR